MEHALKYCQNCGKRLVRRIPYGDRYVRHVCDYCQTVHYENPRLLVGCVGEWDGRILMCRETRGAKPGPWSLPIRYLEKGESGAAASGRAALEDTGTEVKVDRPFALFDVPQRAQVYLMYCGELIRPTFDRSSQSGEVQLIRLGEIPWQQLAHPVVAATLRRYVEASPGRHPGLYVQSLPDRPPESRSFVSVT